MATLEASQVNAFATADFRTMNPQQRMLYAQQQNYVKVYKLGGPSSKRREYAKYFHKSVITPATLTKEFDMEVDYLVDQFNVVLWPKQWTTECRPYPWKYKIVGKNRLADTFDAQADESYTGDTQVIVQNVPPEVTAPDLCAWLRVGVMVEDENFQLLRRAVLAAKKRLDTIDDKIQKLPFRRLNARSEEEEQREREMLRRTLVEERFKWEEELKAQEAKLQACREALLTETVVATPARVDPLHRTVTWYVRFEGEWAERASKAAVNKRDWYEISLARGVELSDRQKEDLAFRYFAERMRRSVVKAVVKDAGAQAVMGAEELERRVNKQLKRQWEALPPDMRGEFETLAEEDAARQRLPVAQEGEVPAARQLTRVRMVGVAVQRIKEGVGRMQYADGEVYDGAWLDDAPHGQGVVFDRAGVYSGSFFMGKRAGKGTLVLATGERVMGEFGYRTSASLEEALARGKGLRAPKQLASADQLKARRLRAQRLLREYFVQLHRDSAPQRRLPRRGAAAVGRGPSEAAAVTRAGASTDDVVAPGAEPEDAWAGIEGIDAVQRRAMSLQLPGGAAALTGGAVRSGEASRAWVGAEQGAQDGRFSHVAAAPAGGGGDGDDDADDGVALEMLARVVQSGVAQTGPASGAGGTGGGPAGGGGGGGLVAAPGVAGASGGAVRPPPLDLSGVVAQRREGGPAELTVAQLAALSESARRRTALEYAPQGLSLLGAADAYTDGLAQGAAVVTFPDGSRYEGAMVDGRIEGSGVYEAASGTVLRGRFKDGALHGRGVMREASGRIVDGWFENGVPHGRCTEFLPVKAAASATADGSAHGAPSAPASSSRRGVDVFDGTFEQGTRCGRGILKRANGDLVMGWWGVDGKLQGDADFMYGHVHAARDVGTGRERLVSDHAFAGRWADGKVTGRGVHYTRMPDGGMVGGFVTRFGGRWPIVDSLEEEEQRVWRRNRRSQLKRAEEELQKHLRATRRAHRQYTAVWKAVKAGTSLPSVALLAPVVKKPPLPRPLQGEYGVDAVK